MMPKYLDGWKNVKVLGNACFDNPNELVIAMHPFFDDSDTDITTTILDKFMFYDGPLLILDDENSQVYNQKFLSKYVSCDRYFITTKVCTNELKRMSYGKFCEFLRQFHNNDPIGLVGGYWNANHESSKVCGCLGSLDFELRKSGFNTELIDGCVYGSKSIKQ